MARAASEAGTSPKDEDTPPTSPPSDEVSADGKTEAHNEVSASMRQEEEMMYKQSKKDEEAREQRLREARHSDVKGGKDAVDTKFKALEYLLNQSKLYSTIMLSQMQKQEEVDMAKDQRAQKRAQKREEQAETAAQNMQRRTTRTATDPKTSADTTDQSLPTRARPKVPAKLKKEGSTGRITDFISKEQLQTRAGAGGDVQEALVEEAAAVDGDGDKVQSGDIGIQNLRSAKQPDLVSGGIMRGYQLEGLEWLTSLYENGLNGILADEMGLGKTIQTISFIAFLREKGINGPFLVAAPLSTTSNWIDEFHRWTPSIPVVLYHGSKDERAEIRSKRLHNPGSENFPIVCTSYEICMNDRKFLAHYGWKYIIIDEGHRIKNMNCRLIRELQSYQSANRLLITGTPLQNNLAELWSLLNFLMPDIFDKLESFESWFDFSALKDKGGHEQILSESRKTSLVTSLHAILKPFLLRRVKTDVEHTLPKKREYVLYAPLSTEQRELYQEILHGNSRAYLEEKVVESMSRAATPSSTLSKSVTNSLKRKSAGASGTSTPNKSAKSSRASTPATSSRTRKAKASTNYEEVSDRAYFKQLENGNHASSKEEESSEDEVEAQRARTLALAKKEIAQKKLQNPIMQLRLCCNSPHNFYDPFPYDDGDNADELDREHVKPANKKRRKPDPGFETLLTASGKMLLLDRLLSSLLAVEKGQEPHKILIFSQFKTQLDLLSLYFTHILHMPHCRIDGSIPQSERAESIRLFNSSPEHRIFLLSTRAGGQGINLASADTVVLYDSDWNPQQDLQAQDRAHRIGQRRNVIVYRLATRATVEEMLLGKAEGKRRLEKLVIKKGGFAGLRQDDEKARSRRSRNRDGFVVDDHDDEEEEKDDADAGLDELKQLLEQDDGQTLDVAQGKNLLSDEELEILTDRSDDAYVRAAKGVDIGGGSSQAFRAVETRTDGGGLLEGMGSAGR